MSLDLFHDIVDRSNQQKRQGSKQLKRQRELFNKLVDELFPVRVYRDHQV